MRMWDVNPRKLCRQHLLGEHLEMHMFIGALNEGKSIQGFIINGLVNPRKIKQRHDELVVEMIRRGYKHNSPLDYDCSNLPEVKIDAKKSKSILKERCNYCKF